MPLMILNLLPKEEMDLRPYPKLKNHRQTLSLHPNQKLQPQWMTMYPHRASRLGRQWICPIVGPRTQEIPGLRPQDTAIDDCTFQ
jgi:hypothetical protein